MFLLPTWRSHCLSPRQVQPPVLNKIIEIRKGAITNMAALGRGTKRLSPGTSPVSVRPNLSYGAVCGDVPLRITASQRTTESLPGPLTGRGSSVRHNHAQPIREEPHTGGGARVQWLGREGAQRSRVCQVSPQAWHTVAPPEPSGGFCFLEAHWLLRRELQEALSLRTRLCEPCFLIQHRGCVRCPSPLVQR